MKFACNKIIFFARINGRKKRGDSGIDLRRGGGSKHPRCAALNEDERVLLLLRLFFIYIVTNWALYLLIALIILSAFIKTSLINNL